MFVDWAIRECAVTDCERGIANLDISDPPVHGLAVNDVVASRDSTQIVSASYLYNPGPMRLGPVGCTLRGLLWLRNMDNPPCASEENLD